MNNNTKRRAKIISKEVRSKMKEGGLFQNVQAGVIEDGRIVLQDTRSARSGTSFYSHRGH